jgi:integrase
MRTKITRSCLDVVRRRAAHDGRRIFVYDTSLRGFGARVTAHGVAFFVEFRIGGRRGRNRRMTIGQYGEFTIDEARRRAQRLKAEIVDGVDVLQKRDDARARMAGERFEAVVARYLDLKGDDSRYGREVRRLLTSDDLAPIAKRPLETITTPELIAIIDRVSQRSPSIARTLFAALRPFFAWCVPRGLIAASPLADVRPPAPVRARDRLLDDAEVRAFWLATGRLDFPFAQMFRLLLLTGQRRAEVAGMRWSEIDPVAATWTLAGVRTKNGRPHIVDLAPQALAILTAVPIGDSDLVFSTTGHSPPSGFSKAKRRLDASMRDALGGEIEAWRTHDLRRTAASGMAAMGVGPHVVERVLNHMSGAQGGLVGVYQRHEYRVERRQALLDWAGRIDELVVGSERSGPVSNVIAFPRIR